MSLINLTKSLHGKHFDLNRCCLAAYFPGLEQELLMGRFLKDLFKALLF
jgi:hypothetical protein